MKLDKLNPHAAEIMVNRYSLRDDSGVAVEGPSEIFLRTARILAEAENNYRNGLSVLQAKERFFEMMYELRFVPNGRTMANAGTKFGQLANCFVLPVEDDLGKSGDSIFSVLRKAILTLQTGGGVGFSFGNIRPKGAKIGAGKGKATGAVSFIKVYDTAFWVIGQGGGRRSAAMAVLPVWHPDIYDFVRSKAEEGVISNFNVSVGITDEFMEAVKKGRSFVLRNPIDGSEWKRVPAKELFSEIAEYAHHNGEPGVLFLDAANRSNPVPHMYDIKATNPCGEQFLGPYENCCLGSVNLKQHVKKIPVQPSSSRSPKSAEDDKVGLKSVQALSKVGYVVDWDKLKETVSLSVRFLDNVVDVNKYVPSVPELEEAAHKVRRIGLSIMGMSDMMYMVGVRYGSKEGQDFASQIMEFIRYHTMMASIELAKTRGAFPSIKGSIYDTENMKWERPKSLVRHKKDFKRPKLDWVKVINLVKKYGIRNGAQNTVAPTGSIATISGLEGYGCEPVFALSYTRNTREGAEKNGKEWREIYYKSNLFDQALKNAGKKKKEREKIFEKIRENGGSCQGVKEVPKVIRDVYVVSSDLSVEEHVRTQAVLQRFVDNSISKTVNFPSSATVEDVKKAYLLGWELGLKGMTVYVEGSREQVVLERKGPFEPNGSTSSPRGGNGNGKKVGKVPIGSGSSHSLDSIENDKHDLKSVSDSSCPECGETMRHEEGCAICPGCAYSRCDK